ncbi:MULTISPECIES: tryptophan 2,3-dioxygenase [unclassified Duganella]|jgi:tryptophan 2,3-dioxygenase|uniref:tryptophan 2,3-dioxygenase n=1 Tax=unclassified Duganella TaxID=2636909 RepID=UPI0008863BC6|nr:MULTISPECIES: tryptophan 2,3-dioxygenase [unclassified Duganella]SDF52740.1 tryptophan 2,3-dioxygenase [Duganella sp. OV458]SDI74561.1 Tryptophan 2,3-dioxygenase holoenzyme /Tryptophan 2,3-dioxygenase apoenzyme [Duganella sp. OV510]
MSENKCPMHGADTNPEWHGAQMDFSNAMSYGDYLGLNQILHAQHPLSPNHNEMLFIIQHQTSELWMKLMLHEMRAVRTHIQADDLPPAFKMLARVARIMDQLVHAWDVLATMTPPEYTAIRPYLGASSGFQSYQYREIEFILGNKNAALLNVHATTPELPLLQEALNTPSIYDEAVKLLARHGLPISAERLNADPTLPTAADESVQQAWLQVYGDPTRYWALYELAEKLVDMETAFRFWRFRHVTTVERIIGFKTGTGGTAGVSYLRKMLDVVLFPELFALRTAL